MLKRLLRFHQIHSGCQRNRNVEIIMKYLRNFVPAVVALLGLTLPSYGVVLLDDTWVDGSRTETSLPNESAVWAGTPGSLLVNTGSLVYTNGGSSQKLWTYFMPNGSPVSLGVGEQLVATIDFTPRLALYDNGSRSFRVGLFHDPTDPQVAEDVNSDGGGTGSPWTDSTGYGVQLALSTGPNASANANVGKRTDQSNTSLMGSSGAWTFDSGGDPIINTLDTLYTITLALDRTAADQMNFTFTISDSGGVISTHSITDDPNGSGAFGTDPIATDFDQLFFRFSNNSSTADAIEFSRFMVEYIPEPSTLALAGLAAIGLFAGHRRMRR